MRYAVAALTAVSIRATIGGGAAPRAGAADPATSVRATTPEANTRKPILFICPFLFICLSFPEAGTSIGLSPL